MAEQPTYVMVKRKTLVFWVITFLVLNTASFQYTNWVDRRQNGFLCELVKIPDDAYKKEPPSSPTGKLLIPAYAKARKAFCK